MRGGEDRPPKVTLEEYEGLLERPHRHDLTIDQLNQIVFMHGFIKLHRYPKLLIMEALKSLELMPPTRSTVRDGTATSPGAALSPDEVKRDIKALGWEECPVGSVLAVTATGAEAVAEISPSAGITGSPPAAAAKGRRGRTKRKHGSLATLPSPSNPSDRD